MEKETMELKKYEPFSLLKSINSDINRLFNKGFFFNEKEFPMITNGGFWPEILFWLYSCCESYLVQYHDIHDV